MARARRSSPGPTEGEALISTGSARFERDPDDPAGWTLLVNGVPSSYVDVEDPTRLVFEYHQWTAAITDVVHPGAEPLRAVHLGGAACAFPRWVAATRPGSRQLVLEIDERLAELVRRSFGSTGAAGFKLRVADAREGLAALPGGTQDLVVRDAFSHDRVPAHLVTREFHAEVARVLAPGGVYVANLADAPPMPRSRAELRTALDVFAHAAILTEPAIFRGRRRGNVLLVASAQELPVAGLARALAGGAAPARLLAEGAARNFCAAAQIVTDQALSAGTLGGDPDSAHSHGERPEDTDA